MNDTLIAAIVALILAIAGWIKQSKQHSDNKIEIQGLKDYLCFKTDCKDREAVPPPAPTIKI